VNALSRLAVIAVVVATAVAIATPYVKALFVPVVVLLFLAYVGRLIWWYTQL
jgi:hypothetical protein